MSVPIWAWNLVEEVCAELHPVAGERPKVYWSRASGWRQSSSGVTQAWAHRPRPEWEVRVTAGTDQRDQRYVLLHELGHWLAPYRAAHSTEYYEVVWPLFIRWGDPAYALIREAHYKRASTPVARRLGVDMTPLTTDGRLWAEGRQRAAVPPAQQSFYAALASSESVDG